MGVACLHWYAIRVRTGSERTAFEQLEGIGLEAFFPFYLEKVRWSDRKKTVERALFPGYIFARFSDRLPVLNIPCVPQVLGDDRSHPQPRFSSRNAAWLICRTQTRLWPPQLPLR
jgi:hypothetical protein